MKTPIRRIRWWVVRLTALLVGSLIPVRIFKRYGWQVIGSRCSIAQYRTGDEGMRKLARIVSLSMAVAGLLATSASFGRAQQAAAAANVPTGPAVNDLAPDFSLAGADRYGLLKTPVKLSDYRGRTVVLAFFFQARTKG
jgi:hypothetical protein